MTKTSKADLINVSNLLAAKAGIIDEQELNALIDNADSAVSDLRDEYTDWIEQDLQKLKDAFNATKAEPGDAERHMKSLYAVAHEMKGQGKTFEYDLVTEIGGSLCSFLDQGAATGQQELEVIELHVNALTLVVSGRIMGDGGETGRKLTAGLAATVAKTLKANAPAAEA